MTLMTEVEKKQPELERLFTNAITGKRLGHAYLFEGARGTGKRALAEWIAQAVFCENGETGKPCGQCRNCRRLNEGNQLDLISVEPDGQSIKVDQIRQLKAEFSKSAVEGSKKVYIIEQAEKMTISAANSLLTFLEEPGIDTYLFLLTTVKENILPTIRSRCQIIHFQPLKPEVMAEAFREAGISEQNIGVLSALTNDYEEAKRLEQDEWFQEIKGKVWTWFNQMVNRNPLAFITVQTDLMPVLKERAQVTMCLDLLLFHYRDMLYISFGHEQAAVHQHLIKAYHALQSESRYLTQQIENILDGKKAIQANVQAQGILESLVIKNQTIK